jgi:hypothetical protein
MAQSRLELLHARLQLVDEILERFDCFISRWRHPLSLFPAASFFLFSKFAKINRPID